MKKQKMNIENGIMGGNRFRPYSKEFKNAPVGVGLVPAQNHRGIANIHGITLIALVITIIILLILAGVVISLGLGENGIIRMAITSKGKYKNQEEKEKKDLENLYSSILIATNDDAEISISVKELKTFIREEVQNAVLGESVNPIGTIIAQMGNEAPAGYIKCDGTTYNISKYKQLAEYIKNQFGSYNYFGGDGTTTFAVPDLRGEFLRGTGSNSHTGNGSGASVGTHQDGTQHTNISGRNSTFIATHLGTAINCREYDTLMDPTNKARLLSSTNGTVDEYAYLRYTSRPTNTSVLYCIKY